VGIPAGTVAIASGVVHAALRVATKQPIAKAPEAGGDE
jgi:hypothetical protein